MRPCSIKSGRLAKHENSASIARATTSQVVHHRPTFMWETRHGPFVSTCRGAPHRPPGDGQVQKNALLFAVQYCFVHIVTGNDRTKARTAWADACRRGGSDISTGHALVKFTTPITNVVCVGILF
jgi:hypothetical protein